MLQFFTAGFQSVVQSVIEYAERCLLHRTDGLRNLRRFIRNVFRYRKLLSEDRDWDWAYLVKWNIEKLNSMREYIQNGHLEGCEDVAEEIKGVSDDLANGLSDEDTPELHEFYSKYGTLEVDFEPCKDTPGFSRMVTWFSTQGRGADNQESHNEWLLLMNEKEVRSLALITNAFERISKHFQKWWD